MNSEFFQASGLALLYHIDEPAALCYDKSANTIYCVNKYCFLLALLR